MFILSQCRCINNRYYVIYSILFSPTPSVSVEVFFVLVELVVWSNEPFNFIDGLLAIRVNAVCDGGICAMLFSGILAVAAVVTLADHTVRRAVALGFWPMVWLSILTQDDGLIAVGTICWRT